MNALLLVICGCWAPDINTEQAPQQPIEQHAPPENHADVLEEKKDAPSTNYSDEEQEELRTQAKLPPYTAWTMKENTAILGPNGSIIFPIPKKGTRVEVQKVVPQYAQVLCSGCAPPKQNQAGWVNIEDISMEWDMPEEDPLLTMIALRREWLKNNNTPTEFSDRRAICMLFDNGYTQTDSGLLWSHQGGEILMSFQNNSWTVTKTKAPTTTPAPSWRCDAPKNPSNQ